MKITYKHFEKVFDSLKDDFAKSFAESLSHNFPNVQCHSFATYHNGIQVTGVLEVPFDIIIEESFTGDAMIGVVSELRSLCVKRFSSLSELVEFLQDELWVSTSIMEQVQIIQQAFI